MSVWDNLTSSDPNSSKALQNEGISFGQLMASLVAGMAFFGVFFWTFYLLRLKYQRI